MKANKIFLMILLILTVFLAGCRQKNNASENVDKVVNIKVGHVGHDHHLALFVAFDNVSKYREKCGIDLKVVEDQKRYELFENDKKIADVEVVVVGGGSKMPAALAQGIIDIGFGGVAPVLSSVDSGAPVRLISPLHYKGDMLVVKPDMQMGNWEDFVDYVKEADKPVRIGYKNPVAVAKVIFEEALTYEGITFSSDLSKTDVQIHMINTKGGGKLNVSLSGDLVDGYVGNNPFPSIAVEKNIGKIVCDLEDLPPGTFRNHPCCCIAANSQVIRQKKRAITALLKLFYMANETINQDIDTTVASAVRWIGTSEAVERMSIPTSGYSMRDDEVWRQSMNKWIETMNKLQLFQNRLKDMPVEKVCELTYDFSLLDEVVENLAD